MSDVMCGEETYAAGSNRVVVGVLLRAREIDGDSLAAARRRAGLFSACVG